MAKDAHKTSRVAETVWSILILIGMALVVAHLASATRIGTAPSANAIEHTFTTRVAGP